MRRPTGQLQVYNTFPLMHTHFSKSDYKNFVTVQYLHSHAEHFLCHRTKFPTTQIKTAFQSRVSHRFSNSFSATGRQFLLLSVFIFYFTDSLHTLLYFAWIYPCAVRSSAHSTAPPAAPRSVLWERPTNFQS